ncbi:hypothetical protein ETD83_34440 [Actinomadura soli]|uniref:Uncharacterized protein n=2 Tax=Actinomadura soli TaxID=2508997 RepID=A0A5C4J1R8_9ACTN|nr:hypothetical protein ETD83_34440 [Actinomadura soli]
MLGWMATLAGVRRIGRFLGLGLIPAMLVGVLAAPARSGPGPEPAPGEAGHRSQWTARPALQQARDALSVTKVGRHILAIGGTDPLRDKDLDVVEARRTQGTGTWRYLKRLPTARGNLATAEVGGLVYAVGGFTKSGPSDAVETYDPQSGRWARSLRLPQPRGGPAAAALGGLLYVAGGEIPGSQFTNSVIVYDPGKRTWSSVAPMPTARERFKLVAARGYLYAIGGDNRVSGSAEQVKSLTTVERYDPRTNRWRTMNPMIEARSLTCAVETTVGKRRILTVVGGAEFTPAGELVGPRRTTEVLDLGTGRWTLLKILLPIARASHDCATEANGAVLTIGGVVRQNGEFSPIANVDALSLQPRDLQ